MKNNIYVLSFIFFFICNAAIGQETNSNNLITIKKELKSTPHSKAKYIYENKTYKRNELSEVIINDKLAWNYYNEYQEKKRNAKRSGIVCGGFVFITLLTSTVVPIAVTPDPPGASGLEYLIVPFFSAIGALLSGATNIGFKMSANKNFDESIKIFNSNVVNKERIGIRLNLKYSQDGIGLVLNF